MNLENLQRVIERNTLLLMYEPGAGGDFLAALLSVDPLLHGTDSNISQHDNGRIKAMPTKISLLIDKISNDYEYQNTSSYYDLLRENIINLLLNDLVSSNSKFISKLHPYMDDEENIAKLIKHIDINYKNSKKLILTRDYNICAKNHHYKNGYQDEFKYYNSTWNENFEKIMETYSNILVIKFADILKNPIYTLTKIYKHMDYNDSQITYNFKINKEKIKSIYIEYLKNQKYLEDVKRYWQ